MGGLNAAFNERTEHIAGGKLDYTASRSAEFFLKGYYHHWDSAWTERHNTAVGGQLRVISDAEFWGFKDYGANLLAKFTPNRGLEYFAGYDFQNYCGYSSLPGIPDKQLQASLDIHPEGLPFGAMLTANRVGDMFDNVSGFGRVPSGDYTVVDLSGRVFVDRRRQHRINVRLENLFDEVYTTRHARGFPDLSATPFLVHNLGVPRTFHLSYSFSY